MKQDTKTKVRSQDRRIFSLEVKKRTVQDIEKGLCSVKQASRELGVSSVAIYKWIDRYSRYLQKNRVMVVEDQSESYRSKELEKKLREAEAMLGRKQMEIDLLNKIIDLASAEYRTDLKKSILSPPSSGSESSKTSDTDTK
jgi:transposase-like protein